MMFHPMLMTAYIMIMIKRCLGKGLRKKKGKTIRRATNMKNRQSPFFIGPSRLAEQPLRPRQDDDEIEAKDDDELDRRGKEVAAHHLDQPHDDARDEGPHDASEAAERHHDEGDEAEITAHLGEDVVEARQEGPGHPD